MTARVFLLVALVCTTSCSHSTGAALQDLPTLEAPEVAEHNHGAAWTTFAPKTTAPAYSAMAVGPDKAIWYIDENAGALARTTLYGTTTEFRVAGLNSSGVALTLGSDKKFYIGDESSSIIRVTTGGVAESLPIPSGDTTSLDGMALGPDHNVWFTEFSHIGKITPAGIITEYAYPAGYDVNQAGGVTVGSDGNVWFAESSKNALGRVIPATGAITMFNIPQSISCPPAPVVLGNDGNVWFACLTNAPMIGSVTPSGVITIYALGASFNTNETEQFCSRGPDGEPWCASGNDNLIFRIDTTNHTVSTFTPPLLSGSRPDAVVAGPDGNVWMDTTGAGGEIAVYTPHPLTVTPTTVKLSAIGSTQTLTVHETGTTHWTATSSNTAVVTVMQASTATTFTATAAGAGTAKVTIKDAIGNTVTIAVTVS